MVFPLHREPYDQLCGPNWSWLPLLGSDGSVVGDLGECLNRPMCTV